MGWVNLKPLAKVDEQKYGRLKIGAGIDAGRREDNFFVTGAYVGYNYKKFSAEDERALYEADKARGKEVSLARETYIAERLMVHMVGSLKGME